MYEIVKIDATEYWLWETEAKQIKQVFLPMLNKMEELENEFNKVIKLDVKDKNTSKIAKELRLKYVKVRTWTAQIHKQAKEYYLAGGRFVDGWKNAQLFASRNKEEKLEQMEKYYENLEKERITKLQEQREQELAQYEVENIWNLRLWDMSEQVWNNFLDWSKLNYETKKEAERKAEEDRLKRIAEEKKEQEIIRKENEKLKKESAEKEKQYQKEREAARKKQIELEKQAQKESEERQKLEDEKRKEQEKKDLEEVQRKSEEVRIARLEKEQKYKQFLKQNEWKYDKIIREEWKVILYKKISEFII